MNSWDEGEKTFQLKLKEYKCSLLRYWRVSLLISLLTFSTAVLVAGLLPDYYQSDLTFFLSPQTITSKVLPAPNDRATERRLDLLIQETLTRSLLGRLIEQLGLYSDLIETNGKKEAVERLRRSIAVETVVLPTGRRLPNTVKLKVYHQNPTQTYQIAKRLSEVFLEESVMRQQQQVRATREFLNAEVRRLRKELENHDEAIQLFVSENLGRLPQHLQFELTRLSMVRSRLAADADLITTDLTLRNSLLHQTRTPGRTKVLPGISSQEPVSTLADLQRTLVILQSRYSERHPDIINLKNRISSLKEQLKDQAFSGGNQKQSVASSVTQSPPSFSPVLHKPSPYMNQQLDKLRNQNTSFKSLVNTVSENIRSMPLVERELTKLTRDYAMLENQYHRLQSAQHDAALQESLVRTHRASKFRIIEQPEVPSSPEGPNRILIAGAGTGGSLALLFCLPLLFSCFNTSYRFKDQIERETHLPVLSSLPSINNRLFWSGWSDSRSGE